MAQKARSASSTTTKENPEHLPSTELEDILGLDSDCAVFNIWKCCQMPVDFLTLGLCIMSPLMALGLGLV